MGRKKKPPVTQAIRVLREHKVEYTPHLYDYVPQGGATASSAALEVDPHDVVKTLIMEDEQGQPLIVLMHGDCRVNTGELARQLNVKKVSACAPETAQKHSGYLVGGTSPFGTNKAMPVYVERTILSLTQMYINGGKRGFLVQIQPTVLTDVLDAQPVDVAQDKAYSPT